MGDAAVPLTELVWGDQSTFEGRHADMTRVFDDVYARMGTYYRKNADRRFVADLTQRAGAKVWALWTRQFRLMEWVPPPKSEGYAKRVACNLLRDHRESQRASVKHVDHTVDVAKVDVEVEEARPGDAGDAEFLRRVQAEVAAMPEMRGKVWKLKAGGWKYDEIARELGIDVSTARSHISDATRQLRESLGSYLEGGQ